MKAIPKTSKMDEIWEWVKSLSQDEYEFRYARQAVEYDQLSKEKAVFGLLRHLYFERNRFKHLCIRAMEVRPPGPIVVESTEDIHAKD